MDSAQRNRKTIIAAFLTIVACGFMAAVAGFIVYDALETLWKAEPATGTVQAKKLTRPGTSLAADFIIDIRYRYTYEGSSYSSENVYPGLDSGWDEAWSESVLEDFPTGEEVTVYVRPDDPETSFLLREGPGLWTWGMLIVNLLLVLGAVQGLRQQFGNVEYEKLVPPEKFEKEGTFKRLLGRFAWWLEQERQKLRDASSNPSGADDSAGN